jgi:multidrug efflux pump
MYLADYSINVLTLLGLVLAIGIVVDDAIVVLENIYKKIEAGMEPVQAGLKGTKEIFFAVVSTTVALAAVFLPIMFLQGLTGRLFQRIWSCNSRVCNNFIFYCINIYTNVKFKNP